MADKTLKEALLEAKANGATTAQLLAITKVYEKRKESKPQEELTPEMMETGQREAAPAYAMTEEKYEAEKKSAGESPLQDGASVGAEADIPATPESGLETYEEEVKEQEVIETPEAGIEIQKEVDDVKITQESYKSKYDEFEKRRDELEKNINDLDLAANKIKSAREEGVDEASILKAIEDYNNRLKELQDEEKSLTDLQQEVESDYQKLDKMQKESLKEKNTWVEDQFGKNFLTDLMGDMARATGQGQAQGGVVMPAMTLFSKGADITEEEAQEFIDAANRMNSMPPSEEMQAFSKTYEEEGSGVWGWLKGMAENPTVIPQLFASSVSAMINEGSLYGGLAGGAAAAPAGLAGGPLAGVTVPAAAGMGFIGGVGATLETGLTFTELLTEELGDKEFTKDNVMEILRDEEKMKQIRWKAAGRGAAIGAIDAISGGLAGKATKAVAKATGRKMLAAGAGGTVEAIGGSIGEVGGRLAAGQPMDIAEIGFEGVAGTATAPITVGYGLVKSPVYKINGGTVSGPEMADFLRNARDQDVAGASIEIKNDSDLKSVAEERKSNAKTDAIIKRDLAEAGITDSGRVNELIPLEKEKKKLQGNTTEAGKKRLQEINAKIDEVIAKEPYEDAIQEQAAGQVPVQPEAKAGEKVEEGAPEAKPEVTTEEKDPITQVAEKVMNDETLTEEEQKLFDDNQEAVDEAVIALEQLKQAEETGAPTVTQTSEEERSAIRKQAENAMKAFSNLFDGGIQIVTHDSTDDYVSVVGEKGRGTSGAVKDGVIHVNLPIANARTVAHEVFHVALQKAGVLGDQATVITKNMLDSVKRSANKKVLGKTIRVGGERITIEQYLDRFASQIDEEGKMFYETSEQAEEQLSELAGFLSEIAQDLDPTVMATIKKWIADMAKALGIDGVFSETMADLEAIDLLNTIAGATRKGEEITELGIPAEIKSEDAKIEESTGSADRFQKNPDIKRIAEQYIDSNGLERMEQLEVRSIDPEYSKKMADVYEAAEDMPNDPEVQKAYKALAEESKKQFDLLVENGYSVEMFDGKGEPYANSKEMLADLKDNKRLVIFSTEEGFGQDGITDEQRAANPMLAESGRVDANGKPMLLNDLFRFVHDAFGHGELGNGFGPIGEENAWYVHSQMFSPEARRAMTSETRGQNSWVNYGKHIRREDGSIPKRSDSDFVPLSERDFAPQKNFLFPDEYVFDDPNMSDAQRIQDNVEPMVARFQKGSELLAPNGNPSNLTPEQHKLVRTPAFKKWFGDWENDPKNASKVVDENGEPLVVYHGTDKDFDVFDIEKLGASSGNRGWFGAGFYFTPHKKMAEGYASNAATTLRKLPLTKEERRRYDEWSFNDREEGFDYLPIIEKVQELRDKAPRNVFEVFLNLRNPQYAKLAEGVEQGAFKVDPKSDGTIADNKPAQDIYEIVVREPNQIKLADGSNKTFDAAQESIRFQKPIKASLDFKSRRGKTFTMDKVFNDQKHMDNYVAYMERKGNKFMGVSDEEGVGEPSKKRKFAKKASVPVGNMVSGEIYIDVGVIKPFTIDGQEFARMSKIEIPEDAAYAQKKRELYTKAVDLAVSEGLGGVIIPEKFFDESSVDLSKFKYEKRDGEYVVSERSGGRVESPQDLLTTKFQYGNKDVKLEVFYYEEERMSDLIRDKLVEIRDSLIGFNGLRVITTSPDDMMVGETRVNGKKRSEGSGGMFFVTKFGDIWAYSKEHHAKNGADYLNNARELNKKNTGKDVTYLALAKGTDSKLLSNPEGVSSSLAVLEAMFDAKLFSKTDFISAVRKAVSKHGGVIKFPPNASSKEIKDIVDSSFKDVRSSTFKKRGDVLRSIMSNIAQSKSLKEKEVVEFLNGDTSKGVGAGNTKTKQSLQDLVALVSAEKHTKGLKTGDIYALVEIDEEVVWTEDAHQSFPFHLKLKSGKSPKLILIKGRNSGKEVLTSWDGETESDLGNKFSGKVNATSNRPFGKGIIDTNALKQPSLKFQSPLTTGYTIHDVINEMRGDGYTDTAITMWLMKQVNPATGKRFTKKEINAALIVSVNMQTSLPSAFGDVEGGVAQGKKMFDEVMAKVRRSAARMKPATGAKVRAKAHEILKAHPDYMKQSDLMKMKLLAGLDASLGTTANQAIQKEISGIKKMISGAKKGAKDVKSAQVRLRTLIRKLLPDAMFNKSEVNALIKKATDATPENMKLVVNEIESLINKKRSDKAISEIDKILKKSLARVESGRKKGKVVSVAFEDAMFELKDKLTELEKASSDETAFSKVVNELQERRKELMSKTSPLTEQEAATIMAYDFLLEYGSSMTMEDGDSSKVDATERSLMMLKDFMTEGRSQLKEQLRMAHESYLNQYYDAFEDMTGIDIRNMSEEERKEVTGGYRIDANQRAKNQGRMKNTATKIFEQLNTFLARKEGLAGFMDILSKGAGELFGGKMQELVTQRVDDSTIVFKKGRAEITKMTEAKMKEIFGEKWKRKVSVDHRIPKKTGVIARGRELIMSQNQIYYIYNAAKDPANHPAFEEMWGKDWEQKMQQLEDQMDPEVKEWADWQVNEFYPAMYQRYNDVYRRVYRTNLPWNQFYAGRLFRENEDGEVDLLEKGGKQMTVAGASTKMRVKNRRPIATMDGNNVMGGYIDDMERFRAFQETVRDVSKLFGNESIKNVVKEQYGESFHKLLQEQMEKYLTGRSNSGIRTSIFSGPTRLFIFSRLGMNLSLVWKQLTSVPTYMSDLGATNWTKAAVEMLSNPVKAARIGREIYDNSVYLQNRYEGDFMDVVDIYAKSKEPVVSLGYGADYQLGRITDMIMKVGMSYTKAGDAMAIFLGGGPAYVHFKNEFMKKNPNATEQEAIQYAIKRFEKLTKDTQQSGDIQDRDYWQTQGDIIKSIILFQTSPSQYWRKSMSGFRQLYRKMADADPKAGKGSVLQNVRTVMTYRFLMPFLYNWVAMGFPALWDLEDEEEDQLIASLILGNVSSLIAVGGIIISVADWIMEKPWAGNMPTPPVFQIASDVIKYQKKIDRAKDPVKKQKAREEFNMYLISTLVPTRGIDNSFGNWYRTATGDQEFNLLKMMGYSDWVSEKDDRKTEEALEKLRKAQEKLDENKGKRKKAGGRKAGE